jgi:uncharacterized protein (DUF2141 family)
MKIWVVFILFMVLSSSSGSKAKYVLTIKLTNIQNLRGHIELGLYKDSNKFPKIGQHFKMVRLKPTEKELSYSFQNLEEGEYALCLYHDEDNNGVCNRNFIGIPTESYAFSNNIRPKWSEPVFEDCVMYLNSNKTFKIKMVY